jgi:hypothetical protein
MTFLKSDNLRISVSRQPHRVEDLCCIRAACNWCGSASVAAEFCHFEDLSDLRVVDLRPVNGFSFRLCVVPLQSWLVLKRDPATTHPLSPNGLACISCN